MYLNGQLLGYHGYGYTNSRYYLNASQVCDTWGAGCVRGCVWRMCERPMSPLPTHGCVVVQVTVGGPNLLAVLVDATQPDGWWYDGGGRRCGSSSCVCLFCVGRAGQRRGSLGRMSDCGDAVCLSVCVVCPRHLPTRVADSGDDPWAVHRPVGRVRAAALCVVLGQSGCLITSCGPVILLRVPDPAVSVWHAGLLCGLHCTPLRRPLTPLSSVSFAVLLALDAH